MIELKCVRIEGGENSLKTVTLEILPSRRALTLDGVDAGGLTGGKLYTFAEVQAAPVAEAAPVLEPVDEEEAEAAPKKGKK